MIYVRENLTLEEVQYVLHSRALQNKQKSKFDSGEGLSIRGIFDKNNPKIKFNKRISKSKEK